MLKKYFLKPSWTDEWTEVTQELWIHAERVAGFYPKKGCGPEATAEFNAEFVSGKIEYIE